MRTLIPRSILALAVPMVAMAGCLWPTDPGDGDFDFDLCPGAIARVGFDPPSLALRIGDTATVVAMPVTAGGEENIFCAAEWSSSNPGVARVVETGDGFGKGVVGVGAGTAWIRVTSKSRTDSLLVTMSTATVASVSVEAPTTALLVGQTMRAVAVAYDSAGNVLPVRRVQWSSSSSTVVQVTNRGLAISRAVGTASLEATVEGRVGTLAVSNSRTAPTITFDDISAGAAHSCALVRGEGRAAGTAYCWGSGAAGGLGTGDVERREFPARVSGSRTYSRISAGSSHTCADADAGAVYCWGENMQGQLGDGTATVRPVPTRVATTIALHAATSASGFTCALDAEGRPYCWGAWGRRMARSPVLVQTTARFASLHAAGLAMCGLTATGAAHCWGLVSNRPVDVPAAVGGGLSFRAVGGTGGALCGVASDGRVYCWGMNVAVYWDPAGGERATPQLVPGGADFVDIAATTTGACAVTTAGDLWCMGQLGPQSTTPYSLVQVARGADHPFAGLTGGGSHACAIDVVGGGWCWGQNLDWQTGVGNITFSRPLQLRIP